ncbi:MAG TPA: hypothetical protein VGS19_24850, partial [Streptosporangiaceae bacterium]|nr:hypothetical protein [Streptosporangiaceae bacterium]
LAAFLAGDLSPAATRRWDEHLLECEQCWQAVREDRAGRRAAELLRQPAPAGLADRVAFAVELAAAGAASRSQPRWGVRLRRGRVAAAGTLALGLAVALIVVLSQGGRVGMPAPVVAVARYAQTVPLPAGQPEAGHSGPAAVEVGHPVTVTADGQRIVMRTWRLGGTEAAVAVSGRPFPLPPGAQGTSGGGMGWSVRVGRLSMLCINARTSELVAAPVTVAELARLVARLPLS